MIDIVVTFAVLAIAYILFMLIFAPATIKEQMRKVCDFIGRKPRG